MSPGSCPSESETVTLKWNKWQFTWPGKTEGFHQPNPIKRQKKKKKSLITANHGFIQPSICLKTDSAKVII